MRGFMTLLVTGKESTNSINSKHDFENLLLRSQDIGVIILKLLHFVSSLFVCSNSVEGVVKRQIIEEYLKPWS
jgi:hypothetical protein